MGGIPTINAHRFPKQGEYLGRRVEVCFNYDSVAPLRGEIVRDDMEEPMWSWRTRRDSSTEAAHRVRQFLASRAELASAVSG